MAALVLAVGMLSQADARSVLAPSAHAALNVNEKAKAASLVASSSKISPPLTDVKSDKKFFGPPFPADYPEDSRPIPDKSILDKLKGPDQPYPALQSKDKFDRDYVKDENSDRGAWKAQFEYDYLRKKLAKEAADAKNAGDAADKEGRDLDDAQKKADAAGKDANGAKKDLDDAKKEEGAAMQPEDFDDIPEGTTKEKKAKLEQLKKAVVDAEANYAKEQKEFEQCKQALEDAKTNLEELKAKQVEMEQKLAAETKLWVESKAVRMNLKKAKEDAVHSKHVAAIAKAAMQLNAAKAAKAQTDKVLAEKKAVAAKSKDNLQKQKAQLQRAKVDMDKATLTLQKLRGYTPPAPKAKSGAAVTSVFLTVSMMIVVHFL